MNILTLDTSSKLSEIGLRTGGKDYLCSLPENKPQSENLLVKIDELLTKANISISDLDIIGVVVGPGSFTGLRISLAVAKGFICANPKIKCVQVNSFELMSYIINRQDDYFMCLSSGNNEPYYALKTKDNMEMGYINISELKTQAKERKLPIYSLSYENIDEELSKIDKQPISLLNLVEEKGNRNRFASLSELAPVYIKTSQAEKELRSLVKEHYEIRDVLLVSDLVEIDKECFTDEAWTLQSFEDELSHKDRKYYVAYYKGKAIGYIGLWITGEDLNLLKIGVIKEFRNLNIASHLLEKALEFKKQNSLKQFFLEVDEHNIPAINLYQKFGFKTSYTRPKYYKNGASCLVMFQDNEK